MNSQLFNLYNASGLGRLASFVKEAVSGNSEIPLEQILLVSRVLFAIVMIGFIGYFFDRTKQTIKETVKPRQ